MRIIYYTNDTDIIIKPDFKYRAFEFDPIHNQYVFHFPSGRIDFTPEEIKQVKQMLAGVKL